MNKGKHVTLLACGDIGVGVWQALAPKGYHCVGVRRNTQALPVGLEAVAADLDDPTALAAALEHTGDVLVITPVPAARSDEGYRQGYLERLSRVVATLVALDRRPFVVLLSSCRVYGNTNGGWVEERTPPQPDDNPGRYLLEMEAVLRSSSLPHVVLRVAGIYGPERLRLLNALAQGVPQTATYSNRIHRDDVVNLVAWLIEQWHAGSALPRVINAVDDDPALLPEVQQWVLAEIGRPMMSVSDEGSGKSHKRCSNRLLRSLGFSLAFPSYKEGYRPLLNNLIVEH